ncbi:Olfactory receptor 18 [Sciurus carolinensis]|uniref:Olfactory receptor 18 n=1 Tax=Sciurus carolinensis TaxID=30640 RepID=A0AA41T5C3_SCICA|nr:Olfactory receptor 18 [Sciurus carolinensis]
MGENSSSGLSGVLELHSFLFGWFPSICVFMVPGNLLIILALRCPINTDPQNLTRVSEFHLMSLSDDPDLQPILLGMFLSMYLVTVLGKLLNILASPKMIVNIQTQSRAISYVGCLTQMSFYLIFACMDDMLLTVMAYDRFVAICHPLRYPVIMNPRLCGFLVLVTFLISLFESQLHNLIALQFTTFKDVEISNFFCDPSQVLSLSCSHSFTNNLVMYFVGAIYGFLPLLGILFSYYKIVSSILRIPSSGGKYKAFSTCGSHLAVVCLFYAMAIGVYLGSAVSHSSRKGAVASVMYTVVTPMLNPFIYSLRNRDIKSTLKRLLSRIV